jgi:ornithine carbamoyltransferase
MVALIFEKPSTRTRVSFDVGVRQMGGQTMVLSGKEMQLGHGETIADTARVLSRYVDLIMIRTFEEATLLEMAEHATVPVINGLTNRTHPCQIMADVMTYEEHRGPIAGRKVVWSGDGNNVCASFLHAAGQFGFDFTFTGPPTLDPEDVFAEIRPRKGVKPSDRARSAIRCKAVGRRSGGDRYLGQHARPRIRQGAPPQPAAPLSGERGADGAAKPDALFMHCLPAHRNDEATSAVMDGPHSVIFDEAENRLHAQKAIMRWCLAGHRRHSRWAGGGPRAW